MLRAFADREAYVPWRRAEAEAVARNEPFHGLRHNTVTAWTPKFADLIEVLRDLTAR